MGIDHNLNVDVVDKKDRVGCGEERMGEESADQKDGEPHLECCLQASASASASAKYQQESKGISIIRASKRTSISRVSASMKE